MCRNTLAAARFRREWNYLCLDLPAVFDAAFGRVYNYVRRITITSACRVGRVFMEDKQYADGQLPAWMRAGGSSSS